MKGLACRKTGLEFPEISHWQGGLAELHWLEAA